MRLQQSIQNVFVQLTASLDMLSNAQYVYAGKILSNATIGQHVRHIIEMFTCLEEGYAAGIINYERRQRDKRIETEKDVASIHLKNIYAGLAKENKSLILEAAYDENSGELLHFDTNYYREIAYNLEHTIHHMALIKVGIREVADFDLPEDFGVASSTIKFRLACAQ